MSPGSSTVVSSPDVAVEAMPLAVQLIPSTACLFFSYLDWSQSCQSWCLHCPEWLCLSGSGLGALHFPRLPLSLCFRVSDLSLFRSRSPSPLLFNLFHFLSSILTVSLSCTTLPFLFELLQHSQLWPGSAAAVPHRALSDIWRTQWTKSWVTSAAERQRRITNKDVMELR